MLTLYTFGPYFGLPDGSPFVCKTMVLLKMAVLSYREDRSGYRRAPTGKLPYIEDGDTKVADSTLIRWHIERTYGFDFDAGLDTERRAVAWACERLCEDHLCWAMLDARWADEANFAKGPARFFDAVPAPIRPLVRLMVRRKTLGDLKVHGSGRHSRAERLALAGRDIDAMATFLGDKSHLMGEAPCGADATLFAFALSLLCPELADKQLVEVGFDLIVAGTDGEMAQKLRRLRMHRPTLSHVTPLPTCARSKRSSLFTGFRRAAAGKRVFASGVGHAGCRRLRWLARIELAATRLVCPLDNFHAARKAI